MPRSAARAAQNQQAQAGSQLSQANNITAGYGANAKSLYGNLVPEAESLVNSTGYDPATLSAITNATMGAATTPFANAGIEANNQVARTRNSAGVQEAQDKLALQKSQAASGAASQVTIENAQERDRLRTQGLNLLNSLYGKQQEGQLGALGAGTNAINAGTSAVNAQTNASPGWAQTLGGVLSGVGGLFSAPLGGGVRIGGAKG